ncbi:hypothetical protein [Thiolapillus sp.]|nr:hypothetical protein [Thiolapillus sp.]
MITTTYGNPTENGRIIYTGQQLCGQVQRQVETVLGTVKTADGQTALDALEWIACYERDGSLATPESPFMEGETFVSAGMGNNEGWLITVYTRRAADPRPEYGTAMIIKYLADRDLVYDGAKALSIAFDEGQFHCEPALETEEKR